MSEFQTSMCPACGAGLFEECSNPKVLMLSTDGTEDSPVFEWIIPCAWEFMDAGTKSVTEKRPIGRPLLDPDKITDVLSTGRKRAAAIMPFLQGQVCGWAGLKHAGGGVVPIVGCQGNEIADVKTTEEARLRGADEVGHRHHGPDKNVLNNTPGVNLHGVCTPCHTRWHALNDPHYDADGRPDQADMPFLPVEPYYLHDAQTVFTDEDYELVEQWWDLPVKERGPYPIAPPETARKALPIRKEAATLDDDNPFPEASPFTEIGDSE